MKNIVKTGLLGVALLATTLVNAAEKIKVTLEDSSKEVNISITNLTLGETINVLDRSGEKIFSETVETTKEYIKSFDFSKFSQGVHYIETITNKEIKVTPFIINPELKKVIKGDTKTYAIPVFDFIDGIATINVENESKQPVTISVSGSGQELDVTKDNTSESITKSYDFSSVSGGDYYVLITVGDRYFSHKIELL